MSLSPEAQSLISSLDRTLELAARASCPHCRIRDVSLVKTANGGHAISYDHEPRCPAMQAIDNAPERDWTDSINEHLNEPSIDE